MADSVQPHRQSQTHLRNWPLMLTSLCVKCLISRIIFSVVKQRYCSHFDLLITAETEQTLHFILSTSAYTSGRSNKRAMPSSFQEGKGCQLGVSAPCMALDFDAVNYSSFHESCGVSPFIP